jgi:hypothetical protein
MHHDMGEVMTQQVHRATRYDITSGVAYWWLSEEGSVRAGEGVTRNISCSGVLIEAGECPPLGVSVQLTVYLPRARGGGLGSKLIGEGVVARIAGSEAEARFDETGRFAASVHFLLEHIDVGEQPIRGSVEAC